MAQVRRRGAVLEQAILRAAAGELTESGYAGLTMDRVAHRAGTNKNAIYRRWPNRAALGVAAYKLLVETALGPPDTGELRADVLAVLRQMNADLATPKANVAAGLMASAAEDPELLAQLREMVGDGASSMWLTMLRRAVDRGEAPPGCLHPRVATVALTLLRNEFMTRGMTPVDDDVIVEIVDRVYLPLIRGSRYSGGEKSR
ncbi:TetR/AcrR family transcriptional regulator [Kutzneria sp. CA-103260]|uniref:TetR/AcrR family transcriptional regulator n=1 Tax=Kutzneria sp. CA-103260 TaxID=2802641 RepID=UPI001BAA5013|nr:TetR/AcrR family transcriptional regulator [Kutzneria sp. CA-103260]QUQ67411.1 TetR family transcriptional regulator [Kutzneria sp. CA-103260]